jgi:hypothetical protein
MPVPSWKSTAVHAGVGGTVGALVAQVTGHSPFVGALFGTAAGVLVSGATSKECLADAPAGKRVKGALLGATAGALAGATAILPSHMALIAPAMVLGAGGSLLAEGRGAVAGGIAGLALTPVIWTAIANQGSWAPAIATIGVLAAAGAVLGATAGPAVQDKIAFERAQSRDA